MDKDLVKFEGEESLGVTIRRLRKAQRYSLRAFAEAVGVSPSFISYFERGETSYISETTIKEMARVLNYSEDELLALSGKLSRNLKKIVEEHPTRASNALKTLQKELEIEAKAYQLLEKAYGKVLDDINPPIDIYKVIKATKCSIERNSTNDRLKVISKKGTIIELELEDFSYEEKFKIAFSIAHIFLHGDLWDSIGNTDEVYLKKQMQWEASIFAEALLMPEKQLRDAYKNLLVKDNYNQAFGYPKLMTRLLLIFEVDDLRIEKRMKTIGLITYANSVEEQVRGYKL